MITLKIKLTLFLQETHQELRFIRAAADFDIADPAQIPTYAPPPWGS